MFSSFAGVCFAVKSKSTVKHLLLTGKFFSKTRKTVYEFFFRKPFSNLLPTPLLSLSLSRPTPVTALPPRTCSSKTSLFAPALYRTKAIKHRNLPLCSCSLLLRFRTANPHPPFSISHGKPSPPLSSHFVDLVAGCGGLGCSWLVGF